MSKYIIKRFNETLQQTEYLKRVRPTRWVQSEDLAMKLDRFDCVSESEWLSFIGQPHTCEELFES